MRIRKLFLVLTFFVLSQINVSISLANVEDLKKLCHADLDFVRDAMVQNSAPYKNKLDKYFHDWVKDGYNLSYDLIDHIGDADDCYHALKHFINGFDEKNINLRPTFKLPMKKYPGFLTVLENGQHKVIYKHPTIDYLQKMTLGDVVVKINNMSVQEYYEDFIKYFYDLNESKYSTRAATINTFIEDGNKFIPTPLKATFKNDKGEYTLDLQYAELAHQAARLVNKIKHPTFHNFKVDMFNNGVWLKIPSFYPNQEQAVIFQGMLSSLKKLGKLDFIVFDLRGNVGGSAELQRAVIRNLYGDAYLKSLEQAHDFNKEWVIKHRLSKLVLNDFKRTHNKAEIGRYSKLMNQGHDFFEEKRDIYAESNEYLFSNAHQDPVTAKIVVFTDNFCSGACWTFVRQIRQVPGVLHLGGETDIETAYLNPIKFDSPSKFFEFLIPSQMQVSPKGNFGRAFTPDKIFEGDFYNDAQVIDWVLSDTNFRN